jgi:hypothetical protein
MGLTRHIGIVSDSAQLDVAQVSRTSAAIQKQVTRDFGPIWDIDATVDAFSSLEDVPPGYWRVNIRDDVHDTRGVKGVHYDDAGQPFALVQFTDSETWSIYASHECLEILADPSLNQLVASTSLIANQDRVEYLVEVCDPCQDPAFSYPVNGIQLSDFYTPQFFDPTPAQGARYSFGGALTSPRQVLEGGYLSWRDPQTGNWWQAYVYQGQLAFTNRGPNNAALPAREFIDQLSPFEPYAPTTRPAEATRAGTISFERVRKSAAARGRSLRRQIESLLIRNESNSGGDGIRPALKRTRKSRKRSESAR